MASGVRIAACCRNLFSWIISDRWTQQGGDSVANHPNQWYQSSVEYHKAKNGVKLEDAPEQTPSQEADEAMDVSTPQDET